MIALLLLLLFAVLFLVFMSCGECGHSKNKVDNGSNTEPQIFFLQDLDQTETVHPGLLVIGPASSYTASIMSMKTNYKGSGTMMQVVKGTFALQLPVGISDGDTFNVTVSDSTRNFTKVFSNVPLLHVLQMGIQYNCPSPNATLFCMSDIGTYTQSNVSFSVNGGPSYNVVLQNMSSAGGYYAYEGDITLTAQQPGSAVMTAQFAVGDVLYTTVNPSTVQIISC
jgi:hypothetical protein